MTLRLVTEGSGTMAAKPRSPFAVALVGLLDETRVLHRRQWAEFLGVSESAISQWVSDKTLPRPEHLRKIVRFLEDSDDVPQEPLREFCRIAALPARKVSPRSDSLKDEHTVDQYMLRPLRAALQRSLVSLPATQQEQILLAANELARGPLSGTSVGTRVSTHALKAIQERAVLALEELGASSICLYIPDPLFDGDFRLALRPGVRYPEALQGPRFPLRASALLRFSEPQCFFKDAQSERALRDDDADPEIRSLIVSNQLYGDFIEREGVESCARLQHIENDRLLCVLFVNYATQEDFDEQTRSNIGSFFEELLVSLPTFNAAFREEPWGEELRRLPIAMQRFVAENRNHGREALKRGLEIIIERILETFGLDPMDTLGTIHVFDREARVLRPAAMVSRETVSHELPVLRINEGDGLISWAALRRRAIIVNDLDNSPFRRMYHPIRDDIRSELAIPMFAGGDTVAVLNLESVHRNAFSERIIRPIAWAASQMAVVWQNFLLRKYDDMLEGLLNAVDRDPQRSLRGIAEVAARELGFARCDIWRYDASQEQFTGVGANHSGFDAGLWPRTGGWSAFVVQCEVPVFISDIRSHLDFTASEWNGKYWKAIETGAPTGVNPLSLELGVQAELGVPLIFDGSTVGVLWLKFDQAQRPPDPGLLRTIEVFAQRASPIVQAAA